MRLPWLFALFSLGILACGKSRTVGDGPACEVPVAVPVPLPASPDVETSPGSWVDSDGKWTLLGENAPPLVVRGVVQPSNANTNFDGCVETLGARHGAPPLAIRVDGNSRALYVFAKARGPIGIATVPGGEERCATAGANKWARLVVPYATDDKIAIMDVDVAGERSGQTSPYVVVVSEVDEEPTLQPEARAPLDPSELLVRWSVKPRACRPEIDFFHCWSASIDITDANGNAVKKIPLKNGLVGQAGCWPDGTGVQCGGASGRGVITLDQAKDGSGSVTVREMAESDGYCPPPEDCASYTVLTKFTVPRGKHLVPDPNGTWPPPTPPKAK